MMLRPLPSPLFGIALFLASAGEGAAISPDNPPAADNSVEAQLAAFQVHEDFTVSLFADESLGIANPVAIQWDPRGRLWVLCTLAYAQLKPGEQPDDKLFVLEDTTGDGRADKSTEFAGGLDMPMGFALGQGGVWLAQGEDLLHLRDTNGDGRADERRIVLTGFGTGDTHQNISNLVFDSGGYLYFVQGLHTFSQVETPWGVSRGDAAGLWRFDPRTERLDPFGFPSMLSQNPCGIALDRWGAIFVKSNGPHLCFATPAMIPTTRPRELMVHGQVGQTPGKSMGAAIVESSHLPDWIQNHAIIAGYFAREVSTIALVEEGSGFAVSPPNRLLYGGHESFRPVDILQGPDGAIYVADWFNPIINHYQVSLRHPDRDYTRGRIWRLAAKDRPPVETPDLEALDLASLLEQLRSGERWTREQARRVLTGHPDPDALAPALVAWMESLSPDDGLALVEGAGILEAHGSFPDDVLDQLASSPEAKVRAVAARVLGRMDAPPADAAERLARLLEDPSPRVRLEAVVTCANRPGAKWMKLALTALDFETDRFLDYALKQAVFALEDQWREALSEDIAFFGDPARLAFVLETLGGEAAAGYAHEALATGVTGEDRIRLLAVLARLGNPRDLREVLEHAQAHSDSALLKVLAEGWETRRVHPEPPFEPTLEALLSSSEPELQIEAIRLAGFWRATSLADRIEALALDSSQRDEIRTPALLALAGLRGATAATSLQPLVEDRTLASGLRSTAMEALALANLPTAAEAAAALISPHAPYGEDDGTIALLKPLLARGGGPAALAAALEKNEIEPTPAVAQGILTALQQSGRSDQALVPLLNQAIGIETGAPEYDPDRIRSLVEEVRSGKGDVERGREIYERPQLACVACHRVGDAGGVIGPSLGTVGAGMPLDQIVEAILWPDRQIKEGYQPVSLTMKDGRVITGYLERESEDLIWYRNTTAPWILPLERKDIATRENIPTLMPAGLTHSLSEDELRDLVAYLASLKG